MNLSLELNINLTVVSEANHKNLSITGLQVQAVGKKYIVVLTFLDIKWIPSFKRPAIKDVKYYTVTQQSFLYVNLATLTLSRLHCFERRWRSKKMGHLWNDIRSRNLQYVQPLFYDLFSPFCSNAPCQFTPLLNFCALIFGLTPFGLAAFHYAYFWREYHFFIYAHFFRWRVKQALGVIGRKSLLLPLCLAQIPDGLAWKECVFRQ